MVDAAERYQYLARDREQFLQRARHNALLTLPSLMALDGKRRDAHLIEPFQGLGGAGITHLASRLTLAFLPAGRPHMRFDLPARVQMTMEGKTPPDLQRGLSLSEQLVQRETEDKDWRPSTLMSVLQLLCAGNVCEHVLPDNTIRVIRLDRFVVRRSYRGGLIEAVLCEPETADTAPPWITVPAGKDGDDEFNVYTWIKIVRKEGGVVYRVEFEVDGMPAGEAQEYSLEDLPWLFLRWSSSPGEDYGRAKVSEHAADLRTLDNLVKALIEGAAMASRNVVLVRPSATGAGLKRRLAEANNGDVLMADPESVELKSFENFPGHQITMAQVEKLQEQLARAFLLLSAGQRDAERVTATEIQRDLQELEAALGGNFSVLNSTMMERRTRLLVKNMVRDAALPPIILTASPTVLTGVEALSRERDVNRVVQLAEIANMLGPDTSQVVLKRTDLMYRAAIGLGLADVVNSQEEMQAEQERLQQLQLLQQIAGPAAQAAMKGGEQ